MVYARGLHGWGNNALGAAHRKSDANKNSTVRKIQVNRIL